MSSLILETTNPFRSDINLLPRLQYSYDDDQDIDMWGLRERQGDFFKLQYCPSDSPYGLYEWNPNTSDYAIDQMLYTLNKQGFRADNFNKEDDAIMFLGCSFTFGVGVSDEDVWCRKITNQRNKMCWNLGVPGGGNQQIYMLLDSFLESGYKPSEVVILWTEPHRKLLFFESTFNKMSEQNRHARKEILEVDLNSEIEIFSPAWLDQNRQFEIKEAIKSWVMMANDHVWFDFYCHRNQTLNLLKAHDIPFIELHCLPDTAHFCQNIDRIDPWDPNPYNMVMITEEMHDLGRDNQHWGPLSNISARDMYFRIFNARNGYQSI